MPIPSPNSDETQDEFIGRCMANPTMTDEYPDNEQRAAVCHGAWDDANKENDMEPLERKSLQFSEFKFVEEGDAEGTFEGYLSVFGNVDHDDDVVLPGAFKRTLKEWGEKNLMPAMFWGHNTDEPIGEWMKMKEDEHGLHVKGRLWLRNATEAVRKAYNLIRSNTVKGLSIGYSVLKYKFRELESGLRVRDLQAVRLYEGSIVPFAANEEAYVTDAKNLVRNGVVADPREFEKLLRDAGLSRTQAKAFLAKGYKALREADDPPPAKDVESIQDSLTNLRRTMKGA
jgi:HK97 family phage prohead protease